MLPILQQCTLQPRAQLRLRGSLPWLLQIGPDELRANMLAELVTQVGCRLLPVKRVA